MADFSFRFLLESLVVLYAHWQGRVDWFGALAVQARAAESVEGWVMVAAT
ncbi:MAG: hypothetical protein K2Q11_04670 [Burkholderiaceae bacterium]|nr:hypothetical protein [Burkholderiaceae bacterium]